MNFCFIRLFTAGTTGCVGRTYITFSFSVRMGDDRRSENCNDQYDLLCQSYCYLFVYYLLLAVLVFYSVFVTISTISCVGRTVVYLSIIYFQLFLVFYSVFVAIYTTSFAGRYLSFPFNPLRVWQLSCFFAVVYDLSD